MITYIDNTGMGLVIPNGAILATAIVSAVIALAFYVLRSIGLYTLAKRNNVDKAFIAFIPCVWLYIACKLVGKAKFFVGTFEKLALWLCIIFTFSEVLSLVYEFFNSFPFIMYYLEGGSLTISETLEGTYLSTGTDFKNLFDTQALNIVSMIIEYVSVPFDFVSMIIVVFVYFGIFKKFWPSNYILASVLSIMGLFAPFIFAIRNKDAVDYNQYVRQMYAGYSNPYGENHYDRPNNQNPQNRSSYEPFSEYGESKDEPFSEFNDKDNKD